MSSFADLEDDVAQEALPASAPEPALAPNAADLKARLAALAQRKRQEAEVEAGASGKKKLKPGDPGKKRRRDKGQGDRPGAGKRTPGRPARQPGGADKAGARGGGAPREGDEDSVDSGTLRGNPDDDNFIDDEGLELGDDELPSETAADEAARLASAPEAMEAEGGDEAEDAVEDLFGRKKKKKSGDEDLQHTNRINLLIAGMEAAAERDMDAHTAGLPAVSKLKMLAEVEAAVAQRKYHELFLALGGLGVLKAWLEPYQDGTLPNVRVRTAILNACKALPIDTSREDLKESLKKSQLGSRVMFLSKCPDESTANRKTAQELVLKWSRPIFFDPEAEAEKRRLREDALKVARAASQEQARHKAAAAEAEERARASIKFGQPGYRWRASIPQSVKLDYVVAPQAPDSHVMSSSAAASGGGGGGGKKDEGRLEKKMREVVRKQKGSTARAAVPSVEGRGIMM